MENNPTKPLTDETPRSEQPMVEVYEPPAIAEEGIFDVAALFTPPGPCAS